MFTKEEYFFRADNLKKACQDVKDRNVEGVQGPLSPYGAMLEKNTTMNGVIAFDEVRLHSAFSQALIHLQRELKNG
ncbi:MAG: hypothetical protein WAR37_04095 [Candidatus Microsaccharimonas sp.]